MDRFSDATAFNIRVPMVKLGMAQIFMTATYERPQKFFFIKKE
jgi:hypothetical protein